MRNSEMVQLNLYWEIVDPDNGPNLQEFHGQTVNWGLHFYQTARCFWTSALAEEILRVFNEVRAQSSYSHMCRFLGYDTCEMLLIHIATVCSGMFRNLSLGSFTGRVQHNCIVSYLYNSNLQYLIKYYQSNLFLYSFHAQYPNGWIELIFPVLRSVNQRCISERFMETLHTDAMFLTVNGVSNHCIIVNHC